LLKATKAVNRIRIQQINNKVIEEIHNKKLSVTQKGRHKPYKSKIRSVVKKWQNKVMNGQCVRCINTQLISEKDTFLWISRGNLKAETEDELVAVQEQVYQNKYYVTKTVQ